ncbi:hypothetical protein ACNS7O_01385 [Haloferacaceae archaeon DSL9]
MSVDNHIETVNTTARSLIVRHPKAILFAFMMVLFVATQGSAAAESGGLLFEPTAGYVSDTGP